MLLEISTSPLGNLLLTSTCSGSHTREVLTWAFMLSSFSAVTSLPLLLLDSSTTVKVGNGSWYVVESHLDDVFSCLMLTSE